MRALLVLSAASMAIAIAPSAGAAPAAPSDAPASSNSWNDSRYQNDDDDDDDCDDDEGNRSSSSSSSSNRDKCCDNGSSNKNNNNCKITICHLRGNGKYNEITVSNNATYGGHGNHSGDIIPAPADGCPKTGYSPSKIKASAYKTPDGDVTFSFEGCPKGKDLGVKIDDVSVAGSPFKVPNGGVVSKTVDIPGGAPGNVIEFTCSKPEIVWEILIEQTAPTVRSFGSPLAVTSLAVSNPAAGPTRIGDLPARNNTLTVAGTSLPARQLGFGLTSVFGLIAFGGLRKRGARPLT